MKVGLLTSKDVYKLPCTASPIGISQLLLGDYFFPLMTLSLRDPIVSRMHVFGALALEYMT